MSDKLWEFEMQSECYCGESLHVVQAEGKSGKDLFCIRLKYHGDIVHSCFLNRKDLIENLTRMDDTVNKGE